MRLRVFSVILSVLLIAWTIFPGHARAGRPLSTEDAETVGQGVMQVELGLDHASEESGAREMALTPVFTYGLIDRLDVALGVPLLSLEPSDGKRQAGIGDIEIHGKYRVLNEGPIWPAFAILGTLKFATGSERRGLGSGATDAGIKLIGTRVFGPITAHLNLGYTFVGASGQDDVFSWGAAVSLKVTEALAFVGELVGETNSDPHAKDDPREVRIGLTYAFGEKLVLDGAVAAGLTRASPDYGLTIGMTVRFE